VWLGGLTVACQTGDREVPGSTLDPMHCLGKFLHAHASVTNQYNLLPVQDAL